MEVGPRLGFDIRSQDVSMVFPVISMRVSAIHAPPYMISTIAAFLDFPAAA